ncbi:hypothetical protein GA516_16840 [Lactobacillus pentosus]|jgi:hypothetical protein|uniref:hypothetical protein n=1 Tax=Lactiplantibacillus pentosus TaxID=1589 RepID=UPI00128DEEC1|nr:hypothetical protein [Lactiplantibacillus pentosus]MPQ20901.1 hypothetical protein [Lactiplantibacillus pentosus]
MSNGTVKVLVTAVNYETQTLAGTSDGLESTIGGFTVPTPLSIKLSATAIAQVKSTFPVSQQGLAVDMELGGVTFEGEGSNGINKYSATFARLLG